MGVQMDDILAKREAVSKLAKGQEKDVGAVPDLPRFRPEPTVLTEEEVLEKQEETLSSAGLDAPVYQDTTSLTHETSRGGEAAHKPVALRRKRTVSGTVQIRDFPRELMVIARSEFPSSQSNTDALAAYVLAKSGKNADVPDVVRDLVSNWDGDKSIVNMEKRITAIEKQGFILLQTVEEMLLMLSYVTFDRLGYRKENPKSARDVNFLEVGVADLRTRLREQSQQQRNQRAVRDGKPIR